MLEDVFEETEQKMKKAVQSVKDDFKTVRTGRANTAMLEGIKANYYGTATPINQLAKIQIPDPKTIVVQPYDPDSLEDIERGIMESDLGLTPHNDGEIIRINIPDLTEERREELTSVIKEYAEDGRIAIRKIRREARDQIDTLKNEGQVSEDDAHRAKEYIQDLTDKHEGIIDDLVDRKTDELMSV